MTRGLGAVTTLSGRVDHSRTPSHKGICRMQNHQLGNFATRSAGLDHRLVPTRLETKAVRTHNVSLWCHGVGR